MVGESGVGIAEGRDPERVPCFGQPGESMQGMEVNVSVGLVFSCASFRGFTLREVRGLYFYLNFMVSIHHSLPSDPFRTAVLIKNFGSFSLKRLVRLSVTEYFF